MIRRPPRSTQSRSSAASDVYKRQRMHQLEPVPEPVDLSREQHVVTSRQDAFAPGGGVAVLVEKRQGQLAVSGRYQGLDPVRHLAGALVAILREPRRYYLCAQRDVLTLRQLLEIG